MGHFAKLFDENGQEISEPELVEATLSWDRREGLAQAWSADGRRLIASMANTSPVWISPTGMRLEGMEPVDLAGRKFRLMAWQFRF